MSKVDWIPDQVREDDTYKITRVESFVINPMSGPILLRRPVLDTGSRAVFTGHNFRHSEFSSESMYLWQVRYL